MHALLKPSTLLLAIALWLALAAPARAQQTAIPIPPTSPPPATQPPPPSAPPPTTAPEPTEPAGAQAPTAAPSPPPRSADEEDEDAPPPPAAPLEEATPDPRPTRTRRPTRTPRTTATVSPTPPVAGGLRLSFSAQPAVPVLRERASFLLELRNQSGSDLPELTLELVVPDVLLDYQVEARVGETARAGNLLRWYLPELPRDSVTSLRLSGTVARSGGGQTGICALLISAGAPIEHCASFEVSSSRAAVSDGASPTPIRADLPTAEPVGDPIEEVSGALASGWSLLLMGLGILGAWLGLQLRGRRQAAAATPSAPDAGPSADPSPDSRLD